MLALWTINDLEAETQMIAEALRKYSREQGAG